MKPNETGEKIQGFFKQFLFFPQETREWAQRSIISHAIGMQIKQKQDQPPYNSICMKFCLMVAWTIKNVQLSIRFVY